MYPAAILVVHIILPLLIYSDVSSVFRVLRTRSKYILHREAGLIKTANAMIQHFNPICRAVRSFPQFAASRLIIALNDFDIPLPVRSETESLIYRIKDMFKSYIFDRPNDTSQKTLKWSNPLDQLLKDYVTKP